MCFFFIGGQFESERKKIALHPYNGGFKGVLLAHLIFYQLGNLKNKKVTYHVI
jgi:hypothetical protein